VLSVTISAPLEEDLSTHRLLSDDLEHIQVISMHRMRQTFDNIHKTGEYCRALGRPTLSFPALASTVIGESQYDRM
jgi:hypothetical protein